MLGLLASLALAAAPVVVEQDTTVELLARRLGDPALAEAIRTLNELHSDELDAGQILLVPAAGAQQREARVVSLAGEGTVTLATGESLNLVTGDPLPTGATICLGEQSFATVRLAVSLESPNHDDVALFPETCLAVDALTAEPGRRSSLLRVAQGEVSVVSVDDDPGTVTVVTPTAVTTGDAGGFRVAVEEGATRTEAVDAPVRVYGQGEALQLEAGQATRVEDGQAPQAAVVLLRSGVLVRPEDGEVLRAPDFRWGELERALYYRIEIATSSDFAEVVVAQTVPTEAWDPPRLYVPYRVPGLWWRVAPIDKTGFVGVPSEPWFLGFPAGVGP